VYPSVASLLRIAQALGVPLGRLFGDIASPNGRVVRRSQRAKLTYPGLRASLGRCIELRIEAGQSAIEMMRRGAQCLAQRRIGTIQSWGEQPSVEFGQADGHAVAKVGQGVAIAPSDLPDQPARLNGNALTVKLGGE
jgi:transcriptional regulator with XRE-family HTH domain